MESVYIALSQDMKKALDKFFYPLDVECGIWIENRTLLYIPPFYMKCDYDCADEFFCVNIRCENCYKTRTSCKSCRGASPTYPLYCIVAWDCGKTIVVKSPDDWINHLDVIIEWYERYKAVLDKMSGK